jgi:hypothetical protein
MIASDGGSERFVNGTVAAVAAGIGPLACMGVFSSGKQGSEANAIGISGGKIAVIGRFLLVGSGAAEGCGAFARQSGLDGAIKSGAYLGRSAIIAKHIDIEPKPIFACGIGGEKAFEESSGASGIAAFTIMMRQAKGSGSVVGIIAQGKLKLAEGEVDQPRLLGEQRPVGMIGTLLDASIGGAFDLAPKRRPRFARQALPKG